MTSNNEKKYYYCATFYMKSGNSFTIDFTSLSVTIREEIEWVNTGTVHDGLEKLQTVDVSQVEAVTYHAIEVEDDNI